MTLEEALEQSKYNHAQRYQKVGDDSQLRVLATKNYFEVQFHRSGYPPHILFFGLIDDPKVSYELSVYTYGFDDWNPL